MSDPFLSHFTPSLMDTETLEAIFVGRSELAGDMVVRVRESAQTQAKHHTLLIGPRGIGKTHLIALAYHRIKASDAHDTLRIAWLREEEWGVSSFLDLLLRIFRALHEEYDDEALGEEVEALFELSADEAERRAEQVLLEYLGTRTLLLIIENLDDVFEGMGEEGQQQFRAFLQNHDRCTVLAAAQSLFSGVSRRTAPFYGFFRTHHLTAFSRDEAVQLIVNIARLKGDSKLASFVQTPRGRARIRAVHHLAGGNPRIYVILSQFLTREALDELINPFMRMMDDLTPYYQARMQWLSPQQRKIVEFLIDRRHPVPVKTIAQRCFMTHQTASGQLRKLREMGYVRAIQQGRESLYELREPLMRLCLEVKKYRGQPIRLFLEILRIWYSQKELQKRLDDLSSEVAVERHYVMQALRESKGEARSWLVDACSRDFSRYAESEDFEHALEAAEERVAVRGDARDWNDRGIVLDELGRHEEALASYERALELQPDDVGALWGRGFVLGNLGRHEEALASFERALERWPDHAMVWRNYAEALATLGRWDTCFAAVEAALRAAEDNAVSEDRFVVHIVRCLAGGLEASSKWSERIEALIDLFGRYNATPALAAGLGLSISELAQPAFSDEQRQQWVSAWQQAAGDQEAFDTALRLLEAAVQYLASQDRRALLELPEEERRLVEKMLELEEVTTA